MIVASLQVGQPRTVERAGQPGARPWRTGYGKAPVEGPVWLGRLNLEGDGQANRKYHGGPTMAVLAYGEGHYPRWRAELELPALPHGAFAENLTIRGADEESVCLGDVWEVGDAQLSVTNPRNPCNNISRYWQRPDLLERVVQTGRTGWYLRVLREGRVAAGDEVRVTARPHPEWTVAEAFRVRLQRAQQPARAAALARCPAIGDDWRSALLPRS